MMLAPVGQRHPLYSTWSGMVVRCHHPQNEAFHDYGARGIQVCARWRHGDGELHGFECFVADMGPRPDGYTLERINNAEGYEPSNCKWATWDEQNRNRGGKRQPFGSRNACYAVAMAFPELDAHSAEFMWRVSELDRRFHVERRAVQKRYEM
jgi:hypothetical protein